MYFEPIFLLLIATVTHGCFYFLTFILHCKSCLSCIKYNMDIKSSFLCLSDTKHAQYILLKTESENIANANDPQVEVPYVREDFAVCFLLFTLLNGPSHCRSSASLLPAWQRSSCGQNSFCFRAIWHTGHEVFFISTVYLVKICELSTVNMKKNWCLQLYQTAHCCQGFWGPEVTSFHWKWMTAGAVPRYLSLPPADFVASECFVWVHRNQTKTSIIHFILYIQVFKHAPLGLTVGPRNTVGKLWIQLASTKSQTDLLNPQTTQNKRVTHNNHLIPFPSPPISSFFILYIYMYISGVSAACCKHLFRQYFCSPPVVNDNKQKQSNIVGTKLYTPFNCFVYSFVANSDITIVPMYILIYWEMWT